MNSQSEEQPYQLSIIQQPTTKKENRDKVIMEDLCEVDLKQVKLKRIMWANFFL